MNEHEQRQNKNLQKEKIRQRYKGVDQDKLEVIPALPKEDIFTPGSKKRVAVYARVSTGDPRQTSSYELQRNHYEDVVSRRPDWELVKIYADEGISGTSLKHRDAFVEMISDCEAGKIDLIVTKSVSRFARNVVDCISYARALAARRPPIGIFFETENLFTLNANSEMSLSFISTLAQEESHTKSEIMNVSIDMRFSRGIFLTPVLMGFDHDEDGILVPNEHEKKVVLLSYLLYYVTGSSDYVANVLMELGCRTKIGNTKWTGSTITAMLQNERYAGDVLARKTWTPSYLDHKSRKNRQDRNQYYHQNHHEAIVPRDLYICVNHKITNAKYGRLSHMPSIWVFRDSIMKGFVILHKYWNYSLSDYREASLSTYEERVTIPSTPMTMFIDYEGYEISRAEFFDITLRPGAYFNYNKIRFSSSAIHALSICENIEILIHPERLLMLVIPASAGRNTTISWIQKKADGFVPRIISATAFIPTLYELSGWDVRFQYRILANTIKLGTVPALLFNLRETEILIPEDTLTNSGTKDLFSSRGKIRAYPVSWTDGFGNTYQAQENHYLLSYTEERFPVPIEYPIEKLTLSSYKKEEIYEKIETLKKQIRKECLEYERNNDDKPNGTDSEPSTESDGNITRIFDYL